MAFWEALEHRELNVPEEMETDAMEDELTMQMEREDSQELEKTACWEEWSIDDREIATPGFGF